LKLENNLQLAGAVNEKIQSGLDDRAVQLKSDREFRTDVQVSLDRQEERSARQVDQLVESLLRSYDKVTGTYTAELSEGLSFFTLLGKSFKSIFNKQESAQNWVNDLTQRLEKDLKQQFDQELNEGVDDIAESIQQMARIIDLKIRNNPTLLTSGHEVFGDIADRRRAVLRELQDEFAAFMKRTDEFVGAEAFPDASTFSPNLAAGSGIATIGVILAAVTNGMALDITGGILTSVGLLFAGVTVMSKRNKIIGGFKNEIAKGREQLKTEIDTRLKDYIRNIKSKIDGKFADFDALLTVETEQLNALNARHDSIDQQLGEMRENLV
ncbi:MAG: GTP-binding protein, partial [Bacteroidota bacterium]